MGRGIDFGYLEQQDPMGYVSMLASRMQRYPIQEVLREPYLTNEFDTQIIDAVLQKLNPNNLILMVTDPMLN